jgi:hypothetical protein
MNEIKKYCLESFMTNPPKACRILELVNGKVARVAASFREHESCCLNYEEIKEIVDKLNNYEKLLGFVKRMHFQEFNTCNCAWCINQTECKDCSPCIAGMILKEIGELK